MIDAFIALLSLTAMEIVLGIDNVVFIAIVAARLPESQRPKAQKVGLVVALSTRILLLLTLKWMMGLTTVLYTIESLHIKITGKSIILLLGGLFLIAKSTHEIHNKLEGGQEAHGGGGRAATFGAIIFQIALLDIVFSLDSVITAVGMTDRLPVMIVAMVLAMIVMLAAAGSISDFVNRHPTIKILALSFLLLIGVMLVAEGFGRHMEKGYIYFAMAFSLFVELLNMRMRRIVEPVSLHQPRLAPGVAAET